MREADGKNAATDTEYLWDTEAGEMKVLELTDVNRRESMIFYRRQYEATAVFRHAGADRQAIPVTFTIEQTATGTSRVTVDIDDSLDYPLVPAVQALRDYIISMDRQGLLP